MTTVSPLPITRSCPYAPPEAHTQLREEAPVSRIVLPDGREAWAVARHDLIRSMLTDPRFSSDRKNPNFPTLRPSQTRELTPPSLISMDPPRHGPARRAVVGEFTVKRMAALRPRIQQIVDDHIDAMLAGPKPADLVPALSLPVPSLVICELLGVPYSDHEFFQARTAKMLRQTLPPDERSQAISELVGYLDELVSRKEREPGDDLLGRQVSKADSHDELLGMAFLLLVAGHETTANMISLGTVTLLDRPEALAAIRDDPTKIPNAVEEMLRFYTIAEFANSRVTVEDVELGGVLIPKDSAVFTLSNTANRDPEAFERPDEFDIDRGARHHIAFGFGAHQCLGQNLARMELQIVFETLFRRIPDLKIAVPPDELRYKDDGFVYGLYELPVTW